MKKLVVKASVVLFAMVLACGGATQVHAKVKVKNVVVKSVMGSNKVAYVAKWKKVRLETSVTVTPNSAKNQKLKFKSNKKAVATVSTRGVIKGQKIGNAKVTVQSNENRKKKATISVRVVYPVKNVIISNKNATLNVYDSKNITAIVTGTKRNNFCKIVQWTTSNKKVATVSAKGTVKAIGVGTATITAKAVDGTGKKASCIVKVAPRKTIMPKVTSIMGISFNSYYNNRSTSVICVSLNQPKALTADNISIMTKSTADAQYVREGKIVSAVTTNNKDYIITLGNNLSSGDYVRVSINALDGVRTREQRFMAADGYQRMNLKANVDYYYSYNLDSDFGYNSTMRIVSGSLPTGLTYNAKDNDISGIPTKVTDNQKCNVSVKDEKGHVEKYEINFIVGDAKHIVVANRTFGDLENERVLTEDSITNPLVACGGSESYTYQMIDDCNGKFTVSLTGSVNMSSGTRQPGTYNPVIRVSDEKDSSIYKDTTWTVVVTKSVKVSVQLETNEDVYTMISFRNTVTGDMSSFFASQGTRNMNVAPGKYDIFYSSISSDGEEKCYYLGKNVSLLKDTSLQYKIFNIFNAICHLQDANGNAYNGSSGYVTACMFNASGKCVGTYYSSGTVYFDEYEAGNYYICFYDLNKKQLIGKTDVFALNGKAEFTVKLDIKNKL